MQGLGHIYRLASKLQKAQVCPEPAAKALQLHAGPMSCRRKHLEENTANLVSPMF